MYRFRLLAPLLVVSFAVQLLLAGIGASCVGASVGGSTAAADAMVGMDMSGTGDARSTPASPTSRDHERPADDQSCNRPANPVLCQVLSVCASGAVTVAALTAEPDDAPHAVQLALDVATPPSRSIAPELPPPRA